MARVLTRSEKMKKINLIVIFILMFVLSSCSAKNQEFENTTAMFDGIYHYEYDHNTENLIEDHYIVIKNNDSELTVCIMYQ